MRGQEYFFLKKMENALMKISPLDSLVSIYFGRMFSDFFQNCQKVTIRGIVRKKIEKDFLTNKMKYLCISNVICN